MKTLIRKVKKNQKVFSQNDKSRDMYYIQSGSVIIQRHKEGEVLTLATLNKGSIFGEMALIDDKARSATAVACEDTELAVITEDEYASRISKVPPWYLSILRVASERLRAANEKLNMGHRLQTISNAAQLIVLILKKFERDKAKSQESDGEPVHVDMKYVKNELVEVLGVTRNVMQDSLDFLEKKNMVLLYSNNIFVEDPDELLNYSRFLKEQTHSAKIELMNEEVFNYLCNLKNLLDKAFAKSDIATFSYVNFETELQKNMSMPKEKIQWFLITIEKMNIVKFVLSDGKSTSRFQQLANNGQLRFDSKFLAEMLQTENFKRMGL